MYMMNGLRHGRNLGDQTQIDRVVAKNVILLCSLDSIFCKDQWTHIALETMMYHLAMKTTATMFTNGGTMA